MPFSLAEIKLIVLGVMLLGTAFFSAYITHRVDSAHLLQIEAQYQQTTLKATEAALAKQQLEDQLKNQQALDAAAHQQLLTRQTQDRLDEVSKTLKNANAHCITWGVVQLLNATILNSPAYQVSLPSGQSLGACSTVTADTLLRNTIKNYGVAAANGQQLNDLINSIKGLGLAEAGKSH